MQTKHLLPHYSLHEQYKYEIHMWHNPVQYLLVVSAAHINRKQQVRNEVNNLQNLRWWIHFMSFSTFSVTNKCRLESEINWWTNVDLSNLSSSSTESLWHCKNPHFSKNDNLRPAKNKNKKPTKWNGRSTKFPSHVGRWPVLRLCRLKSETNRNVCPHPETKHL